MFNSNTFQRVIVAAALAWALPAVAQDAVFKSGFETGETAQPANFGSGLGANLDGVVDYSTSYNFVDVFKQSRAWITTDTAGGTFDTGDEACLDLDADGFMRSLTPQTSQPGCSTPNYNAVQTLFFFGELANHYPSGQYVVTYQGQGSISYHFAAVKNNALSTAGRDVLDVNAAQGGWMMRLNTINAADPIRNIHVWMPGFNETTGPAQVFHPDFLRLIERYKVLRFMDWMNTNNSTQQEFANRPRQSHARWTVGGGVPIETMVALANRLSADPWFTMPHLASDDYMTQFANLVKAQLRPESKVYVEYSNEVWNGQFQQGTYVEQQGNLEFSGGSGFDRRLNWHGKRTAQMCDLWKAAWGTQSARVVCVLGAQAANAYTQTQAADCPKWSGGPCVNHHIDAVAIAPYFGGYLGNPSTASTVQTWNLNTLFAEFNSGGQVPGGPTGGALNDVKTWITSHKAAANTRALHLITYEGGQHLAGIQGVENNDTITALFTGANRDARMGQAYTDHLNFWKSAGGEMFMVFTASSGYGKFGSWGAAEYIDNPNASPKHQAVMNFITNNPCWWTGCSP